jgi:hypothetical protein
MFEKVVWWTGKFLDESKRWERKRWSGDFWRKESQEEIERKMKSSQTTQTSRY